MSVYRTILKNLNHKETSYIPLSQVWYLGILNLRPTLQDLTQLTKGIAKIYTDWQVSASRPHRTAMHAYVQCEPEKNIIYPLSKIFINIIFHILISFSYYGLFSWDNVSKNIYINRNSPDESCEKGLSFQERKTLAQYTCMSSLKQKGQLTTLSINTGQTFS